MRFTTRINVIHLTCLSVVFELADNCIPYQMTKEHMQTAHINYLSKVMFYKKNNKASEQKVTIVQVCVGVMGVVFTLPDTCHVASS